jgi:hypothetical protein
MNEPKQNEEKLGFLLAKNKDLHSLQQNLEVRARVSDLPRTSQNWNGSEPASSRAAKASPCRLIPGRNTASAAAIGEHIPTADGTDGERRGDREGGGWTEDREGSGEWRERRR